jgi:hypothetical protein
MARITEWAQMALELMSTDVRWYFDPGYIGIGPIGAFLEVLWYNLVHTGRLQNLAQWPTEYFKQKLKNQRVKNLFLLS